MQLVFDIGNTNIKVAVFINSELQYSFRLDTDKQMSTERYGADLLKMFQLKFGAIPAIDRCIISSVVPEVTINIIHFCKEYIKVNPLLVSSDLQMGISIKVDEPQSLGIDRLVNAVATKHLFGYAAINIDMGTALVIDYIDAEGCFQGGLIFPGPQTAAWALAARTAKLPEVQVNETRSIIGKNTVAAIQSGIYNGLIALVDGVIEKIIETHGPVRNVVLTGGVSSVFVASLKKVTVYEPILTLKGLQIISDLNRDYK